MPTVPRGAPAPARSSGPRKPARPVAVDDALPPPTAAQALQERRAAGQHERPNERHAPGRHEVLGDGNGQPVM